MIGNWFKRKIALQIKKRLDNYKIEITPRKKHSAQRLKEEKSVLVIGAGLAGIASASVLSERGFKVVIHEKNDYIGGKIAAWQHQFPDGYSVWIDHGFHAFFYQYYNLNAFVKKIGSDQFLEPIGDYLILNLKGENLSFKNVEKTPLLNIISLARNGFFRIGELMRRESQEMGELLKYHPVDSFEKYDGQSFQDFCERLQLPANLALIFTSFTRAFFAEPDQMSMAELIKSFHFFYLSHDFGIDYDFFTRDYQTAFTTPLLEYFLKEGIEVKTCQEVKVIERSGNGYSVDGENFDYVVLASDVLGTKKIIEASKGLRNEQPELVQQLNQLKNANGYSVYKIWIKGEIKENLPVFVITERKKVLDSVTQFHEFEPEAGKWAEQNIGAVLELHCYSVTPEFYDRDKIILQFKKELFEYFPELYEREIVYEHLQLRQNFTSFQTHQYKDRPRSNSSNSPLKIAGDWVKLPLPAMLMEGAFTSGLLAANEILEDENLSAEPIYSVPLFGLLVPKKKRGNQLQEVDC